jgi:hypothetical protein
MKIPRLVIVVIVAASIAVSASGQSGNCTQKDESTRPDCPGALAFFRTFQSAFRKNDRQKLASLISYPVLTTLKHKEVRIRNPEQLLSHSDEIFDEGVRCAILNATEKDVWGNWRGFTIDRGAIWFDVIIPRSDRTDTNAPDYWTKFPFKIITINNDAYYPCKTS